MTYYDFRVNGLPMTVVQADGQNIEPVETDELRIAVAETYDVIVTLPDDRPRTLFAEAMDRSGFARGTIGPRPDIEAAIPERRRRPMLTMADMGMMHAVMNDNSSSTRGLRVRSKIYRHRDCRSRSSTDPTRTARGVL